MAAIFVQVRFSVLSDIVSNMAVNVLTSLAYLMVMVVSNDNYSGSFTVKHVCKTELVNFTKARGIRANFFTLRHADNFNG